MRRECAFITKFGPNLKQKIEKVQKIDFFSLR